MPSFITCDTELSELISVDDVKPYLDVMKSQIVQYEEDVTNTIHIEQTGGLSSNGFTINSVPILSNKADNIVNEMNIESSFNSFNDEVMTLLDKQRKLELVTLTSKISIKLSELNQLRNSVLANISYYTSAHLDANLQNSYKELQNLDLEIDRYNKKLEIVKGAS